MNHLKFRVLDWIGDFQDPATSTLAAFKIDAGSEADPIVLTEVADDIAKTIRQHINVPLLPVTLWMVQRWWRLRWEPERGTPSYSWRLAHSMSAIGGGYAWPPIEIFSDGPYISLRLSRETKPDAAAIRYLSDVRINVPAETFERAVDEFIQQVMARATQTGADAEVREIWDELNDERRSEETSKLCRVQALAGIDPGDAPQDWLNQFFSLEKETGPQSLEEIAAILPELGNDIEAAQQTVKKIRDSKATIDLSWIQPPPADPAPELPWERGARLAHFARSLMGLNPEQPILDLDQYLSPTGMDSESPAGFHGGFRNGRTHVHLRSTRNVSQRFFLARLIGCALVLSRENHLLPVTDGNTALQKMTRSFAQELLCPWAALKRFVEANGLDEEAITKAAEYFQVSPLLILTALVNKGEAPRTRLWNKFA